MLWPNVQQPCPTDVVSRVKNYLLYNVMLQALATQRVPKISITEIIATTTTTTATIQTQISQTTIKSITMESSLKITKWSKYEPQSNIINHSPKKSRFHNYIPPLWMIIYLITNLTLTSILQFMHSDPPANYVFLFTYH